MVCQRHFQPNQGANLYLLLRLATCFVFGNLCFLNAKAQPCQTPIQSNSFSIRPAVCNGTVALLQGSVPSGGNGNYAYQWQMSDDGGCGENSFVPIPGATSRDYHVPASTDQQKCFRRVVISGTCTSNSNKTKVMAQDRTTPQPPAVTVLQPTCSAGGTITVTNPTASSGFTFSVDGTNYSNNAIFTGLASGTYSVSAKHSSGCISPSLSVTLNPPGPPTGTVSPATATICAGQSQVLTASGGTSYRWYRNGTLLAGVTGSTYAATQAGTYRVDIIQGSCTGTSSNSSVVTVAPLPTGTISPATSIICAGDSVLLSTSGGASYQWYRNGTPISGAVAAAYQAKLAGTYTVDITNSNGCKAQASNNAVVSVSNAPSGSISPANATICTGGSSTLTASGGATYQWYRNGTAITGATSANYTATQAGTYTADIFNSNGCKGTSSNNSVVTIGTPAPTAITPASGQLCGTTASLLLMAVGGSSYQWYRNGTAINGAMTATYLVTTPGTYTVDIINGNCPVRALNNVVVTQVNAPVGNITPATAAICPGGNQLLTASGGTSYQWMKDGTAIAGATSSTYSATQAGIYTVIITNGTCSGPASNTATITIAALPSGSISPGNATICSGASQLLTATGGTTYQWYRDNTAIGGATGATYAATQSGTYSVDLISANGCRAKAANNAVVTVSAPPIGAISPASAVLCTGDSVLLTITGGASYQWYKDGTLIAGATFSTYKAKQSGAYTVEIINSNGCKSMATNQANITITNVPGAAISPANVTICTGSSATLTTSGGATYQWYRNGVAINGATAPTYNVTLAGTYTADIISSNGCRGAASNAAVVAVGALPSSAITPSSGQLCGSNASVVLTVGGGTSYQWFKDGLPISGATTATYAATSAGTYTADIISGTCSGKASNQVVITQVSAPTGSITPAAAAICPGNSQLLTANGGTSYQWMRDGVAISGATSSTYSATQAGVYTVTITSGTCSSLATNAATVTMAALPGGSISPATVSICTGGSQVLSVSGGVSYQWYRNNTAIPGATSASHNVTQAGTYSVDIIGSNGCRAKASNEVIVTLNAAPNGTVSPASANLCLGDSVTLSTSGGASYQWYKDGAPISGALSSSYKVKQTGVYTVEITGSNGCKAMSSNQATVTVTTIPSGTIAPANLTICAGGSATLTISGGTSYQWYKDGVPINGATAATYTVTQAGTYTSDIISGNGCKGTSSNSAAVVVGASPTSTITPASGLLCGSNASLVLTIGGGTSYQWYKNGVAISGATSPTYTVTTPGTYTADIFSGSCSGKALNNVVVTQANAPSGTISPANASLCPGNSQLLTATGGTSYEWRKDGITIAGATSSTFTATQPGVYTVIINNGTCSAPASNAATISVEELPNGAITPAVAALCAGGSQVLTASGGTTYQWYRDNVLISGATSATYTATQGGTYSADVTNANGCQAKALNNAVITVLALPSGTVSPASGLLCGNATLSLAVSGGTSYQWYHNGVAISGATTDTYIATTPGTYTADIKNDNCTGKASNSAVVTQAPLPAGTISPAAATICSGSSQLLTVTATNGNSYQWFRNNSIINGATAATFLATQAGTYTVVISNSSCSSASSNAAIVTEISLAPSGAITPASAVICPGTAQVLTASGGTSYQWYRNGVAINGATAATYSVSADGVYAVDLVNSNGCRAKALNDAVVTVSAVPSGNISPSSGTICNNGSLTLTASGGASYQWYRNDVPVAGATTSSLVVTSVGNYTVDIINSDGCKAKAFNTSVITAGAAPTGTISPSSAAICSGQGVTLTATGGVTYQWFLNGALIAGANSATLQAVSPGVYSIIIFSGTCNGPASNTATVTESTPLTFSVTVQQPNCTKATGTITVTNPFGGSGSGYMYSIDGGTNYQASNTFSDLPAGNYQVAVKDAAGCRSNSTAAVISAFVSTLQGSVNATNIGCTQTTGSATVTASGGSSPYQYSLNNGPFQTSSTFSNLTVGTYKAIVKDAQGCTKELPFTIQAINSTLSAAVATTDPTCHQQAGAVQVTASGGSPGYSYSLDGSPYQAGNTFSNVAIGSHKVSVKDQVGCLFEITFDIKQTSTNPKLLVVNPSDICPNEKANLLLPAVTQGSDTGLVFSYWKDSNATVPLPNPDAVTAGTYYIKATNSAGCLTVKPVVVATYTANPGRITKSGPNDPCTGQTITLIASDGQTFQWYRNRVPITGATGKSLAVSDDGTYSVGIFDGRCPVLVSDSISIQFRNCPVTRDPKVFVPTAFTPNKNGANDVLRPILYNVTELRYFKIYNRWGQLVFQTNIIGKGWDGMIKGLPQPPEPYSWILECIDSNGNLIKQSGRSLLIR